MGKAHVASPFFIPKQKEYFMFSRIKTTVFLFGVVSFGLINCAEELPVKELALAKSQVERAERLSAEEYAPDEYAEAKKSLVTANELAAEEKAKESRKNANYAVSKAYDALEKTLPKLTANSREVAIDAIDQADQANAGEFSPESFQKANEAKSAAETKLSQADASLASYLKQEKDDEAKALKREVALQEYEDAHLKFKEAANLAAVSKTASVEKAGSLRSMADELEAEYEKASVYTKGTNPAVEAEKAKIQSAKEDLDAGRLKAASEKINSSKAVSAGLLADVTKDYARNRNSQARDVVEDANSRFAELNAESLLKTKKEAYASTQENLGASNESLQASTTLLQQEKYQESVSQSEEAIRLAEISIDQVEGLKGNSNTTSVSNRKATDGVEGSEDSSADKDGKDTKSSAGQIEELSGGWKRYTVEKSNPADCLWRIAEKEDIYSDAKLWPRIFEANKKTIRNKNLIYPKQKLNIPPKTGKIGSVPKN